MSSGNEYEVLVRTGNGMERMVFLPEVYDTDEEQRSALLFTLNEYKRKGMEYVVKKNGEVTNL